MLRLSLIAGLSAVFLAQAPTIVEAQASAAAAQAQAEARGRVVCGAGTLVSAEYVPGGLLRVTCSQQTQTSSATSTVLAGGLSSGAVIGAVLGVAVIGLVGGGGSPSATTTTTTTTTATR